MIFQDAISTISSLKIINNGLAATLTLFTIPFRFREHLQMASASQVNTQVNMELMTPFVICTLKIENLSTY